MISFQKRGKQKDESPLKHRAQVTIRSRLTLTVTAFGVMTLVICLLAPMIGTTEISLIRAFDRSIPFAENIDAQIFFIARLPRVIAGTIVGAALSAAGVVLFAPVAQPKDRFYLVRK